MMCYQSCMNILESHTRLTSESVLLDVLDLIEGEVELVEVLELEQSLAGHLVQRVPGHVQPKEVPGKVLMREDQ